ncbi:hypothetical protein [Robiginitalea sp.]|uniref:hypothetical protein n=1 Tax=Robiginitalea sp. TaxID=1902411 RepID=UPI003C70AA78
MFSTGQVVFALLFILVFVFVVIRMYRKDLSWSKKQYSGVFWILLFFIGFIALLVFMKYSLKS